MVGFKLGNFVRIQGLKNEAYNGKLARIESVTDKNGRFAIELQDEGEVASNLSRVILIRPINRVRACDCCHRAGAATMQYCGQCKNAAYCNTECQRSDWKRHKVDCSVMTSQRQLAKSPLLLAAARDNMAEVQNLVREGADVNKALKEDGSTPLIVAAIAGHVAIVQYLIQQGADKDKTNHDGMSSLYMAASSGHLALVQYLVQQGADMNLRTKTGYEVINNGGETSYVLNDRGYTALTAAIATGHTVVADYLREHGAVH